MVEGFILPKTSNTADTIYNNYFEMIDVQLTTDIFGLFASTRLVAALKMANEALKILLNKSYSAKMFDFVK